MKTKTKEELENHNKKLIIDKLFLISELQELQEQNKKLKQQLQLIYNSNLFTN
jgi:hypothetical protein